MICRTVHSTQLSMTHRIRGAPPQQL